MNTPSTLARTLLVIASLVVAAFGAGCAAEAGAEEASETGVDIAAQGPGAVIQGISWGGSASSSPLSLVGMYENHLYDEGGKSEWHYVTVSRIDATRYLWSNAAGVSWTLTLTSDLSTVKVGSDCPYYASGYRQAKVLRNESGYVTGILGPFNEPYTR